MKILCLGNADNFGIRVYDWLNQLGMDVSLCRLAADESPERGDPYLYLSADQIDRNPKIWSVDMTMRDVLVKSLAGSELTRRINSEYDVVVITGGIQGMILSRMITLPKILIHIGYEIHYYADKFRGFPSARALIKRPRHVLGNHICCAISRNALSRIDKVADWFPPTVAVNKSLGFDDKIFYLAFGEDVFKNRTLTNTALLAKLNEETRNAEKVFLWFSRLNFLDADNPAYKGPHLFLKGLESRLADVEAGKIAIYMGGHGTDKDAFIALAKKSPVYPYIKWVEHLPYPDLLAYLSIDNAVLFSEFGKANAGISGIGRDGYTVGVPMVNATTEETMILQYNKPGERYYADSAEEVVHAMAHFMTLSADDYQAVRARTLAYGEQHVDKAFFLSRLIEEMRRLVAQRADGRRVA